MADYVGVDVANATPEIDHAIVRRAKRSGSRWIAPAKRLEIYERDNWSCQICGDPVNRVPRGVDPKDASLDHITPRSKGGSNDPDNLRTACHLCNSLRGDDMSDMEQREPEPPVEPTWPEDDGGRRCEGCGAPMNLYRSHARTCSPRCRVRVHRRSKGGPIPYTLRKEARWVRWRKMNRAGGVSKMPTNLKGFAISVTDPGQWSTHSEASKATAGDGLGFVLNGDGLACVDLDGVMAVGRLDSRAAEFIASLDPFYVEVSPSGQGVHAWVRGGSPDGRSVFRLENGLKVEWYADKRFICMTGNRLEDAAWKSPAASVSVV